MKPFFAALFLSISFLGTSVAQENSRWKLAFHNDGEGAVLDGELDTLIQAIRNGQVIRVYWSFQHPQDKKIKVEHIAEAKFLTIMSDSVVFAQIDPIIGQTPNFEKQSIVFKENMAWSLIAASNGKSDTMMRNVKTGDISRHNLTTFEIKWFVER